MKQIFPLWIKNSSLGDDPYKISLGGKNILDIIKETNFKLEDFTPYIPPSAKELDKKNIQVFILDTI